MVSSMGDGTLIKLIYIGVNYEKDYARCEMGQQRWQFDECWICSYDRDIIVLLVNTGDSFSLNIVVTKVILNKP